MYTKRFCCSDGSSTSAVSFFPPLSTWPWERLRQKRVTWHSVKRLYALRASITYSDRAQIHMSLSTHKDNWALTSILGSTVFFQVKEVDNHQKCSIHPLPGDDIEKEVGCPGREREKSSQTIFIRKGCLSAPFFRRGTWYSSSHTEGIRTFHPAVPLPFIERSSTCTSGIHAGQ